jgi:uncharacterized membrane protein YgdD (TMEM256/DUF423 family)
MSSCRFCLVAGAILAGLSVAAGAFGAHGLDGHFYQQYAGRSYEKKLRLDGVETVVSSTPLAQKYLADFKTGAEYQMYHGLALIAVGLAARFGSPKWLSIAGGCFLAGILGFSGGLYVYTLFDARWAGMFIVPLGGTLFLAGWTTFALALLRGASPAVQNN